MILPLRAFRFAGPACLVLALVGCSQPKDGADGAQGAIGPKGDTGATGATGQTGPAGLPGASVLTSSLGIGNADCAFGGAEFVVGTADTFACNGAPGPQGTQGPQGTKGADGADGQSVTSIPLAIGDTDCPNGGTMFVSVSGNTFACNGADGARGANGADGAAGAQGPTGPQGPQGPSGDPGPHRYFVAIASHNSCPPGFNADTVASIASSSVYTVISRNGVYLGPSDTLNPGAKLIRARVDPGDGITTLCTRSYVTEGHPYASLLALASGSCPTGSLPLVASDVARSDGNTWAMLSRDGLWLGGLDDYGYDATSYDDGVLYRKWSSTDATTFCLTISGVENDPTSRLGVFPVYLGVQSAAACPAGFTYLPAASIASGGSQYLQMSYGGSILGGASDYGSVGADYESVFTTGAYAENACLRAYPTSGFPFADVRTTTGACPAGWLSLATSDLAPPSTHVFLARTGGGLFAGSVYSWSQAATLDGFVTSDVTTSATRVCIQVGNVSSFP